MAAICLDFNVLRWKVFLWHDMVSLRGLLLKFVFVLSAIDSEIYETIAITVFELTSWGQNHNE